MRYSSVGIYDENVAVWLYRGRRDPPPNPWDDGSYVENPGPFFGDAAPLPSTLACDICMWLQYGGARVMFPHMPFHTRHDAQAVSPMHPLEWAEDHEATKAARDCYTAYLRG